MPFTITRTDGTPITVSTVQNNTFALTLSGTGSLTYPEDIAQNFIRHLENFSNTTPPSSTPLQGQLWYDRSLNMLKVYDGVVWVGINTSSSLTNTDDLPEGNTNLYFSNILARNAISTSGDVTYDSANGIISYSLPTVDPYDQSVIIACSDEFTPISTGLVATLRVPFAMVLTEVKASLTNAQASGNVVTVDIKQNNTSILSTLITIDNTEKTSLTSGVQPVISNAGLLNDAELTVHVTDLDANTTATGLKVSLNGYSGSAGYIVGYTGSRGIIGFTGSLGGVGFTGSAGTGTDIAVRDESNLLTSSLSSINFVGAGVTATNSGNDVTVTISGGGGGSGFTGSQGVTGFAGSQGVQGFTGSVGPAGSGGSGDSLNIVTTTSQTAVVGTHYILTNAAASNVTLPSGASLGDQVTVTVANGRLDNTILRNGANIMSLAENLTLNIANSTTRLRYVNTALGWWIV